MRYKIGDRVFLIDNSHGDINEVPIGTKGTVVDLEPPENDSDLGTVLVKWEGGDSYGRFNPHDWCFEYEISSNGLMKMAALCNIR